MSDAVLRSTQGRIGILTINNPPVNALAAAVRDGIRDGIEAFGKDANVDAIILIGSGRTFIAGADIREFGKPRTGANLNDVIASMENCPKLVVAALHGTPLGGGLETALGAHYRVALPSTRVGLPEVHLGILPGAGGTQRLPRLTGAKYALDAIISGRHIPAAEAKSKGIVDALVEGDDLLKGAIAHTEMLLAQKAPLRRVRDLKATLESPDLFKETEKAIARRARGFKAPWNIIKCVQAAVELPFDEGMKREGELFQELLVSSESAAQRYYFFAEREAAKVLDVPADTPQRPIKTAGIIGAGTMGGGIAMNFANAGIPVTLLEVKQEALDRGLKTIRTNYENTAKRGGMKAEDVEKRMALITPTLSYDGLKDADVVIQNFRPGALEKLGFGYEDVRKFNDRVVYVSISGFGPDGPRSGQRVYDNVIQAASGLASVQTDKATGRPQVFRTLVCDKVTSYTVAQAVTAALFARERGRGGQHIEISMLDSAIAFMWPDSAMDAALLDDDVARRLLAIDVEDILETRAAPAGDTDAQHRARRLRRHHGDDAAGGLLGHGDGARSGLVRWGHGDLPEQKLLAPWLPAKVSARQPPDKPGAATDPPCRIQTIRPLCCPRSRVPRANPAIAGGLPMPAGRRRAGAG